MSGVRWIVSESRCQSAAVGRRPAPRCRTSVGLLREDLAAAQPGTERQHGDLPDWLFSSRYRKRGLLRRPSHFSPLRRQCVRPHIHRDD